MPNLGAFVVTPSNATFDWLVRQVAADRAPLSDNAEYLLDQAILGAAFGGRWYVAGAAGPLCTGASRHWLAGACNGFYARMPRAVR